MFHKSFYRVFISTVFLLLISSSMVLASDYPILVYTVLVRTDQIMDTAVFSVQRLIKYVDHRDPISLEADADDHVIIARADVLFPLIQAAGLAAGSIYRTHLNGGLKLTDEDFQAMDKALDLVEEAKAIILDYHDRFIQGNISALDTTPLQIIVAKMNLARARFGLVLARRSPVDATKLKEAQHKLEEALITLNKLQPPPLKKD